ncbi:hypothetical protein SOASR031_37400 [Leminorella grimontii]|nr:hypothetical protein SOASR031_37400 [Leminorella grimontii]
MKEITYKKSAFIRRRFKESEISKVFGVSAYLIAGLETLLPQQFQGDVEDLKLTLWPYQG